eukprot:1729925-Prymnesium_polylepis.1
MVSSHPSWTSAVQSASGGGGYFKGRRVRVTQMRARTDLVGKKGIALSGRRDEFGMRYEVLLDDGTKITPLGKNLEVLDEGTIKRGAMSFSRLGVDELSHVIAQVLFRNEGFGDVDVQQLAKEGKLTTSAVRFAALSSVSIDWLQATKSAAAAKLAQLRTGITVDEAESSQFPRLAGRALMMRTLQMAAAKAKVDTAL